MSDAGEFQITPEEERFLRAFFRRQAGRYLIALGALAIVSLASALAISRPGAPAAETLAEPSTAAHELDALRAEHERLRVELAELAERRERPAAASGEWVARLGALEKRVATALGRIERVEQRARSTAGAAPAAPAAAADPDPAQAASVRERLYNLEARQESVESQHQVFQKDLLERMRELEESRAWLASHRAEVDRSVLERLDSLEQRAFNLERSVTTAPAAPAR